jgi:hypothetical protein
LKHISPVSEEACVVVVFGSVVVGTTIVVVGPSTVVVVDGGSNVVEVVVLLVVVVTARSPRSHRRQAFAAMRCWWRLRGWPAHRNGTPNAVFLKAESGELLRYLARHSLTHPRMTVQRPPTVGWQFFEFRQF